MSKSKHVMHREHKHPKRMKSGKDKRVFSATAQATEGANKSSGRPMRGGIRL
nr:MAG: hypothetical protein [Microvirus sp.]